MKIESIRLNSFRSHGETVLGDLGRFVLIMGPNNSGKSGIIDGIVYALTGTCRGTDEAGRGYESLFYSAGGERAKAADVALRTSKGNAGRMVGQGPKSAAQDKIQQTFGLGRVTLRCALRAQFFLDLDPKEQEAVLRALLTGEVTPEQAAKALGVTVDGLNPLMLTTADGVVQAYQYVYGQRAALKKQLEAAHVAPAEPEPVTWAGQSTQGADNDTLAAMIENAESVSTAISQARQSGVAKASAEAAIKCLNEEIADIYRKWECVEGGFSGKVDALEALARAEGEALAAADKKRYAAKATIDAAQRAIGDLRAKLNKVSDLGQKGGRCPSCSQEVSGMALRSISDGLAAEIKAKEKVIRIAEATLKKLQAEAPLSTGAANRFSNANADLGRVARLDADLNALRGRFAALANQPTAEDAEACDYEAVVAVTQALRAHQSWRQAVAGIKARAAQVERAMDNAEAAVTALGPGGPVRALHMGQGMEEVYAEINAAAQALGVGKVEVITAPRWLVKVSGRPAEMLSASERFRVSLAFSAAIAKRTGVNMVCLDGADILDEDNRSALISLVEGLGMEQVVIAATSTSARPVDGWSVYSVAIEDGLSSVRVMAEAAA